MHKKLSLSSSTDLVPVQENALVAKTPGGPLPTLLTESGRPAVTAWDDFFDGKLRDRPNTRLAYERAVRYFLTWAQTHVPEKSLAQITAGDVGRYLGGMRGGIQKKKQHLAGLRKFFNLLVERHVVIINPAAVAETERFQVVEGLTPIITDKQFRQLLGSLDLSHVVGLRDRAILGVLAYTIVRGGAVGRLDLPHYYDGGDQWMLRFREKGNKSREIPVSHDLKVWLDDYLDGAGLEHAPPWQNPENGNLRRPLFPTTVWREKRLTNVPMTSRDVCRMMQRHLKRAGLPTNLSPHSFRVAGITDLLGQKIELADVQTLAGHADPRTTRLYDRSERKVTRNLVERIKIGR